MYTGTLIEDLITAVERAEYHARAEEETAELERLFADVPYELTKFEPDFLGVA